MICDACIIELAATLSLEAQKIFNLLATKGQKLNMRTIRQETKLTYAITQRALFELYHKQLVRREHKGRSVVHWLSEEGVRLSQIINKEGEI